MKTTIILAGLGACTHLQPSSGGRGHWKPPEKDDERGPCPALNTLANHNFLPHDGKFLTEKVVVNALFDALHFDPTLGAFLFNLGLPVNPEPNATFFTLGQLNKHNIIEHDASLSRSDAYFGNNHVFNQTVFDWTKHYWTAPTLTVKMITNAKLAREVESRAFNPTYTFPNKTNEASLLELAAPISAFGDPETGTVKREFVEYLFENERLPVDIGWVARAEALTKDDMFHVSGMIRDATNLITPSEDGQTVGYRGIHSLPENGR